VCNSNASAGIQLEDNGAVHTVNNSVSGNTARDDGSGVNVTTGGAVTQQRGILESANANVNLFTGNECDANAVAQLVTAGAASVASQNIISGAVTARNTAPVSFAPGNPAATVSLTAVMMGLGATCVYTPSGSGRVLVNVTGGGSTNTSALAMTAGCRYGTGTAPVNGAAVTGTRFGGAADQQLKSTGVPATVETFGFTDVLVLTPGTAYWFDVALAASNASNSAEVLNMSMTFAEL
jgi:hypothetical protein